MNQTVTAIVVTYNRLDLLKKLIDSLSSQTLSISKIVIVNNCSTDGTLSFLTTLEDDKFIVSNLDTNTGSAGGFAHGLKVAEQTESNFYWILDDDGMPLANTLEELIKPLIRGDFHYAACNLITPEGIKLIEDTLPKNHNLRILNSPGGPFNGILISRTLLHDVGVPMEVFFIWGEEMEYVNRIKEAGYITFTVKNSTLIHKSTKIDYKTNNRLKLYVRNLIFQFRLKRHNGIEKLIKLSALTFRVSMILIKVIKAGRLGIIPELIASIFEGISYSGLLIEQKNATDIFK